MMKMLCTVSNFIYIKYIWTGYPDVCAQAGVAPVFYPLCSSSPLPPSPPPLRLLPRLSLHLGLGQLLPTTTAMTINDDNDDDKL